ncbi:MAG: hypothetical protein ACPHL6_12850 [Rubripirellula sp.]
MKTKIRRKRYRPTRFKAKRQDLNRASHGFDHPESLKIQKPTGDMLSVLEPAVKNSLQPATINGRSVKHGEPILLKPTNSGVI